jgi:hypothetical protein
VDTALRSKAYATAASQASGDSAAPVTSDAACCRISVAESITSQNVYRSADNVALCASSVTVALPSATQLARYEDGLPD